MRAVVLVGGFGTRLRPLTLTTPKPLLPVGHRPILERVVANLARGGVTEVVLSIGFKPDAFRMAYPDGTCAGVRLQYAVEDEPLDTAGAIRFAATTAGFADDTFVAVNGDVLTDLDISGLIAFHRQRDADATIHLTRVSDPSAFGVVPTDEAGRVLAFVEKPPKDAAPTDLINAGTYILEPAVLERIPEDRPVSIERETFPALARDGALFALATDDYWLDAGRPDQFLQANLDQLDGCRRTAPAAPIGPGAAVDPTARVDRSIVGAGARVEAGVRLCNSVLLPGARVGAKAVVQGSILGRRADVGQGAVLVDAVIGDDERVGVGAVLEQVRVPERS